MRAGQAWARLWHGHDPGSRIRRAQRRVPCRRSVCDSCRLRRLSPPRFPRILPPGCVHLTWIRDLWISTNSKLSKSAIILSSKSNIYDPTEGTINTEPSIQEGFIPFRGYKSWYRVVGDGETPGKLPVLEMGDWRFAYRMS